MKKTKRLITIAVLVTTVLILFIFKGDWLIALGVVTFSASVVFLFSWLLRNPKRRMVDVAREVATELAEKDESVPRGKLRWEVLVPEEPGSKFLYKLPKDKVVFRYSLPGIVHIDPENVLISLTEDGPPITVPWDAVQWD